MFSQHCQAFRLVHPKVPEMTQHFGAPFHPWQYLVQPLPESLLPVLQQGLQVVAFLVEADLRLAIVRAAERPRPSIAILGQGQQALEGYQAQCPKEPDL